MSNRIGLTIIIPMFAAENRISHALSSILEQGREDIEIICVDDVSPDNQVAVVEKLQETHPVIRLIRNDRNMGPGGSTNAGIDAARGDYVVIVHADDTLLPGALDTLGEVVTDNKPDLVLVGCDEMRRGTIRALTDPTLTAELAAHPGPLSADVDPRVLLWPPSPWSKVYQREFLNRHALRFPEGVFEDIPWSIHTTLHARTIAVAPGPLYRYVTADSDSSSTTTLTSRNLDRLDQIRLVREGVDVSGLDPAVLHYVSALVAIHLIWANRSAYKTLPPETHQQFFYDCAAEIQWWHDTAPVSATLDTEPLMSASDRSMFSQALLTGDWAHWQATLDREKKARRVRRLSRRKKLFSRK